MPAEQKEEVILVNKGTKEKAFPKKKRLLKGEDFKKVFSDHYKNKFVEIPFLVLSRKNGQKHSRLGIVIAKKKIKNAVRRNLFKRILREGFRKREEGKEGKDIIIIITKKETIKLEREKIHKIMDKTWAHLK